VCRHCGIAVPVEPAQIDSGCGAAGRAADAKEPMASSADLPVTQTLSGNVLHCTNISQRMSLTGQKQTHALQHNRTVKQVTDLPIGACYRSK
jgi:hypothetical protein